MTKEKTKYSQETGKIKTIITETQIINKNQSKKKAQITVMDKQMLLNNE